MHTWTGVKTMCSAEKLQSARAVLRQQDTLNTMLTYKTGMWQSWVIQEELE